MRTKTVAWLMATLIAGVPAAAKADQDEPIAPDRPGFLVSSATVGANRLHLEFGLAYERDKNADGKSRAWATPISLRYGLADHVELRLEGDAYTRRRNSGESGQDGLADLALGLKWRDGGADAATAWWFNLDLPSGSSGFRGEGLRPAAYRVAEWVIDHTSGLAAMAGVKYDRDTRGSFWSGAVGMAYSRKLSERVGVAAAIEGQQFAGARHGGNVVDLNLSVGYLADKDIQYDMALTFGLNDHTPDLAWTVGASLRF